MKKAAKWITLMVYLFIGIVVVVLLVGNGKPVFFSVIAGLLWGPLLIYGLLVKG